MGHCDVCALLFTPAWADRAHAAGLAAAGRSRAAVARHHQWVRRLERRSRSRLHGGRGDHSSSPQVRPWRIWAVVKRALQWLARAGVLVVSALGLGELASYTRLQMRVAQEAVRLNQDMIQMEVNQRWQAWNIQAMVDAVADSTFKEFAVTLPEVDTSGVLHRVKNTTHTFAGREGAEKLAKLARQNQVWQRVIRESDAAPQIKRAMARARVMPKMRKHWSTGFEVGEAAELHTVREDITTQFHHKGILHDEWEEVPPPRGALQQVLSGAVLTMGWTAGSTALAAVVEWLLHMAQVHYAQAPAHVKSRISFLRFAMRLVGGTLGLGLSWLLVPGVSVVVTATTILVVGTVMAAAELWRMTTELRTRTDLGKKITLAWLLGMQ